MNNSIAYFVSFEYERIRLLQITNKANPVAVEIADKELPSSDGEQSLVAAEFAKQLLDLNYRNQNVIIGLDCYQSMLLEAPGARQIRGAQSLEMILEASTPIDAENMVAVEMPKDRVLIAIKDRIAPFVSELQNNGIQIAAITSTNILLARFLVKDKLVLPDAKIVFLSESSSETVEIQNKDVDAWIVGYSIPGQAEESIAEFTVFRDAATDVQESPSSILFDDCLAAACRDLVANRFEPAIPSFEQLLDGTRVPPIGRALQSVGLAVAFVLFAMIAANLWELSRISNEVSKIDENIAGLYQQTFPNAAPTRLVERMLKSECERVSGQAELVNSVGSTSMIINSLYVVAKSIPTNYAIQLSKISVSKFDVVIGGVAETLNDVDELKRKLESSGLRLNQNEQKYGLEFELSYALPSKFEWQEKEDVTTRNNVDRTEKVFTRANIDSGTGLKVAL